MIKYIVKSKAYNVLNEELDVTLCSYENKVEFRQPYFERAWTVIEFNDEKDALSKLRELYPERLLTVFEDTGKVLTHLNGERESWLTSIVIRGL